MTVTARQSTSAFRISAISLALLGASTSGHVLAQWATNGTQWAPHGYVGANIGRTEADFHEAIRVTPPTALALTGEDDDETAYKLYGGYRFSRMFAVEGGFFDLGRYSYRYGNAFGTFAGDTRFRGVNLDLLAMLPIWDRFSAFGRIGATYTWAETNGVGTGIVTGPTSRDQNEWGVKYGAGVEYAFSPALAVRAEWERYRLEDPVRNRGHVDMASIGLVYRFGGTAPAPTRVVAPPPPPPRVVTPPPPPPPRVVPPPPPPRIVTPPPPPPPPPAPAPAPRPYRN